MELKQVNGNSHDVEGRTGGAKEETEIKMEDILEEIDGFGRFQFLFACVLSYVQVCGAMMLFSPVFTSTNKVTIYCRTNWSTGCDLNCTEPPLGGYLASSVVQEWELICSRKWIADAFTSCQMAGMMFGGIFSSFIADRFGRKIGFWYVTFSAAAFGMAPAMATDPFVYAFTRFLTGFGVGGILVVHIAHLLEFLTPAWRVICAGIPFWYLGQALLGPMAYYLRSWRCLTMAVSAPVLLTIPCYWFIPESPRWLLTKNRTQESYEILQKVARINSKASPELKRIQRLQSSIIQDQDTVKNFSNLQVLRDMGKNRELLNQFVILTWLHISANWICFGVSFNAKELTGDRYLNMVYMGLCTLVAVVVLILCNRHVGRKRTLFSCMFLTFMWELVPVVNYELGDWVKVPPAMFVASTILGRSVGGACQEIIGCIILETFPTTMRTSCLGMSFLIAYMGSIAAPQTAFLNDISLSVPYMVYATLALSSAFVSLSIKETATIPLRDSIKGISNPAMT